jgi:GT2 family glycosyltransferase
VVLAYGADALHAPLVQSLQAEGVPPSSIVIVHNPARPDEPPPPPSSDGVTVLRLPRNLGYAGGMNAGIRHHLGSGFRWVLILTNDLRFHPGSLQRLLESADRADDYGLLGPALRWSDGRVYFGASRDRRGWVRFNWRQPVGANPAGVAETDWVQGCALLARSEVLNRVGLFDERFFMYVEETELCLRVRRAGWKIGVVPEALAEQEHGHMRRPALHSYLIARNTPEYLRKAIGYRAVAVWLWRQVPPAIELLRIWKGRRSAPPQRRQAAANLRATWQGTAAFFTGRWGIPPSWLWNEDREARSSPGRDMTIPTFGG